MIKRTQVQEFADGIVLILRVAEELEDVEHGRKLMIAVRSIMMAVAH